MALSENEANKLLLFFQNLSATNLERPGLFALAESLRKNTSLKTLKLECKDTEIVYKILYLE